MGLKLRSRFSLSKKAYVGFLFILGIFAAVFVIPAIPQHAGLVYHETIWHNRKPGHYKYILEFGAASVLSFAGPVKVEVRDSVPISITQVQQSGNFDANQFSKVNSIDKLFGFIHTTLEDRHDRVEMEFDPQWHYPTRAMMATNMPEGDAEVRITSFTPLQ